MKSRAGDGQALVLRQEDQAFRVEMHSVKGLVAALLLDTAG